MLSDPVAEAFGLIHRHPSGENFWHGMAKARKGKVLVPTARTVVLVLWFLGHVENMDFFDGSDPFLQVLQV